MLMNMLISEICIFYGWHRKTLKAKATFMIVLNSSQITSRLHIVAVASEAVSFTVYSKINTVDGKIKLLVNYFIYLFIISKN